MGTGSRLSCKIVKAALGTEILLKYLCKCKKKSGASDSVLDLFPNSWMLPFSSQRQQQPWKMRQLLLRICVKNVEQTIFIIDFHVCHGKASSMAVDKDEDRDRGGWGPPACQPLSKKGQARIEGAGKPNQIPHSLQKPKRKSRDKCDVRLLTIYQHVGRTQQSAKKVTGICKGPATFSIFPA